MKSSYDKSNYDVVVVGAGPAGIVAAIQVARAGQSCLLVEKSSLLGGATVLAGVNFPGLFHAWGKQVIAGIGWEIVVRAVEEIGGEFPDFSQDERPHYRRQVLVDRFTYAAIVDEMMAESGVDILLHTMPVGATLQPTGQWQLELAGKEGITSVAAHVLIDATGDANLVSLAGGRVRRNSSLQPGTLVFRAAGYEPANLDFDTLIQAAQIAIDRGEILNTYLGGRAEMVRALLCNYGENTLHVTNIDARTSSGKTEAELKGRSSLLRLQRFLRKQAGLENFHVVYFAPECGIRETVTIEGEVEVTQDDYCAARRWEDAVCYSFYPIDVHRSDGLGIDKHYLEAGMVPTMPLRAMLPQNTTNLLAVGRIACGDKKANSAFRVQASCMAMGQAAGAVAALTAQSHSEVRHVEMSSVRSLLERHGAILPA